MIKSIFVIVDYLLHASQHRFTFEKKVSFIVTCLNYLLNKYLLNYAMIKSIICDNDLIDN
jgi:uncharacterized membrane protein YhdT